MRKLWEWLKSRIRGGSPSAAELRSRASKRLREGNINGAIRLLQQSLEMEPSNLEARVNLGVALYLQKRYSDALAHFQYVLGIDPNNSNALLNQAACYDALGQTDRAISILRQTALRFPNMPDVHYNLALALAKTGQWTEALDELKKELQSNPTHAHALRLLHQLRLRAKR